MKLDLFLLLCFSGVVPVTHSILQRPLHLYLVKQAVQWSDALNYCRLKYTDLAKVKDNIVLKTLNAMAASNGITSWPLWIGLYNDYDNWRWSFNNISLKSTNLTNWSPGQPDNVKGVESCGAINATGYWEDDNCVLLKPFICYNDSSTGADRYVGVSTPKMTWTDAQTYCRTSYTDLASSLTQTDNDLLAQVASGQGTSWFGLYRDTWKWMNETPSLDIPWASGKPNNSPPQRNCGTLWYNWVSDDGCQARHYFFCELIPSVRKQTVRLQVKSDGTVFDPAVQSSILALMNQKLKENGMLMNTTVSWKVQPDGNIFSKENKDKSIT